MGQETVEGEEGKVKGGLLDLPVEVAPDLQVVGEQWLKSISKAGSDGGSSLATPQPLALIRMLPQRSPPRVGIKTPVHPTRLIHQAFRHPVLSAPVVVRPRPFTTAVNPCQRRKRRLDNKKPVKFISLLNLF